MTPSVTPRQATKRRHSDGVVTNRTAHPGLTIRVYTVDPQTLERTGDDKLPMAIAPAEEPMVTLAWPPCGCAPCRKERA